MNVSKWNVALLNVSKHGIVGNCPACGSVDTDYEYFKFKSGRGTLDVWCISCKTRISTDCMNIPDNPKTIYDTTDYNWDDVDDILHCGTREEIDAIKCPECDGELEYTYIPEIRYMEISCKGSCGTNIRCHKVYTVPNFYKLKNVGVTSNDLDYETIAN